MRIREPGEVEPPATKETQLKRSFFVKLKCSKCGIRGHNKLGCHKASVAAQSSSQVGQSSSQAAQSTAPAKGKQTTANKRPRAQSQRPAAPKTTTNKRPSKVLILQLVNYVNIIFLLFF